MTTQWKTSPGLVPYDAALTFMEARVQDIRLGKAADCVWLLEHPPLYTAGTSAKADDLVAAQFPVHHTGRGGQYTYHGPGQRVAYVMMDLQNRGMDLRAYVRDLEDWVIRMLDGFGVAGTRRDGLAGVWVGQDKICAIGVRVRKWVAYHGIAVNVAPDLSHYAGIVPCGVRDGGVTSLAKLGVAVDMAAVDAGLEKAFAGVFGVMSPRA